MKNKRTINENEINEMRKAGKKEKIIDRNKEEKSKRRSNN